MATAIVWYKGLNDMTMTIESFEQSIRFSKVEHGAIFDANGNMIAKELGNDCSVEFNDGDLGSGLVHTMTHNHPQGSSFSLLDIEVALDWNIKIMRVVTKNHLYTIDLSGAYKMIREYLGTMHSAYDMVYDKLCLKVERGQLTDDQAHIVHHHEVWQMFCKIHTEIIYTRQRI